MGAIASLSLNLGVNLEGWTPRLKEASKDVEAVGRKSEEATGGIGGFAAGIAGIGLAAAGATAAIAAFAASALDRIDQLSDAAQRLGVATDALSEMRHVANLTGSSAEDLDAALEKLNANLGDAATKANPTSAALERLGLSAKDLAGKGATEAFREIVAGFEKVPNAADRASIAMDIFGKGGIKILNTLGSGAGQLDQLAEEARALGISVSAVDASSVGAAKDAIDRASAAIEGLGNKLAIALTPAIVAASEEFSKLFLGVSRDAPAAGASMATLVEGVATVADAAQDLGVLWKWTGNAITISIGSAIAATGQFNNALLSVIPFTSGLRKEVENEWIGLGKAMVDEARKINKDIDKALVGGTAGERIRRRFSEAAARLKAAGGAEPARAASSGDSGAARAASDLIAKLKEQAETFGMTAAQIDLYKLAQAGATEAQLAEARALAGQIAGLDAQKKAMDELKNAAKGYWESSLSAAEKYEIALGKIDAAQQAGLIDDRTAAAAVRKAGQDAGLGKESESKFAGAAELGSSGAYSSIVNALSGKGDGMRELNRASSMTAANTAALLAEARRRNRSESGPLPELRI